MHPFEHRRRSTRMASARAVIAFAFGCTLAGGLGVALMAPSASAQLATEEELAAQKSHWQEGYRRLLTEAVRLEEKARRARENYARAQRRNYPRGGARQQYIVEAETAEKDLAELREEIRDFQTEARRQGAYPGWLYEVEQENIPMPTPASADESDDANERDRDGRNPRFFEDED